MGEQTSEITKISREDSRSSLRRATKLSSLENKLIPLMAARGECRCCSQSFLHFVTGLLKTDDFERWSAQQALSHPFITGRCCDLARWIPKVDPSIFSTKLDYVDQLRNMRTRAADRLSYLYFPSKDTDRTKLKKSKSEADVCTLLEELEAMKKDQADQRLKRSQSHTFGT